MTLKDTRQSERLPAILDLNAAGPLAARLLALRGAAVMLDASQVSRLGGLCLQVLLSAQATWAADGVTLDVTDRSQAFDDALALFGAGRLDGAPGALP
jgi:chemotaxis protein CheX